MTDAYGFITEESDKALWDILVANWNSDHKPGFVMRGQTTYQVFILNDVPKFKQMIDKEMYNDVSMGM